MQLLVWINTDSFIVRLIGWLRQASVSHFFNGLSHAQLLTDKELQLWTETEQDQIQDNSKNRSYNTITKLLLNLSVVKAVSRQHSNGIRTCLDIYASWRKQPCIIVYKTRVYISIYNYAFYLVLTIILVNKSDRPLHCHGKVICVVSQLFL